jgi:hypothetical protein
MDENGNGENRVVRIGTWIVVGVGVGVALGAALGAGLRQRS